MVSKKDENKDFGKNDYRLELIQQLLVELASGNLSYRSLTSERGDELDAIITGINMLGEELQSSTVHKDFLNTVFESIMDMVIVLDAEFNVESINQSFKDVTGYSIEDMKFNHFKKVIGLKSMEFSSLINNLNIHRKIKNFETNYISKSGHSVSVSISLSKLIGKNGEEKGILVIAKEIGHLKKIEAELKKRNDELNTFIYKLSHDMRGPLSSIIGLTDIAGKEISKNEKVDPKETSYYIDLMRESALKLDGIIRSLNEVIHLRQRKPTSEPIELKKEVTLIVKEKFIGDTKYSVFVDIPEHIIINSDLKLLKILFENLLDNAQKFKNKTQLFPFCEISASEMKNFTLIKIKDNGRGISENHVSKIFTMFHRATADVLGSGLGLFIAKSIVDKLQGEIQVFSKIGEGTEFLIFIPN